MKRNWMKKLWPVSALLVAMTLWACEGVNNVAGPEQDLSPKGDINQILSIIKKDGYTIIKEDDASVGIVSGTIDEKGGELTLGNHVLTVPAGAVTAPTLFTITKSAANYLSFDLSATRLFPNDVGARGFNTPVKLTVSYAGAQTSVDPSRLSVLWVKLLGTEKQPTTVDTEAKTVTGDLSHFSVYAIGDPGE